MPRIPQIEIQQAPQGEYNVHRANPEEFGAGRGIESFGKSLGSASETLYKSAELSEQSNLAVQLSQAHSEYTNYLEALVKKGDLDPADFQQKLNDHLSQIGDNVTTGGGREYFNDISNKMLGQFNVQATHAASQLAGEKAVDNLDTMINQYSTAAIQSPDSFGLGMDAIDKYLETHTEQIGEKNVLKLKQAAANKMAMSAADGMIQQNPAQARKDILAGKFKDQLTGESVQMLLRRADEQLRANRIDAVNNISLEEKRKKDLAEKDKNALLPKIMNGSANTNSILKSNLSSADKENFINFMEKQATKPIITNSATYNQIAQRVFAPDTDPKKIVNTEELYPYVQAGKLSLEDLNKFNGFLNEKKTPEGSFEHKLKAQAYNQAVAKFKTSHRSFGPDPIIEDQKQVFQINLEQALQDGKKEGKSVQNMLNPQNKDYVVKSIIDCSMLTPSQICAAKAQNLKSAPATLSTPQPAPGDDPSTAPDPSKVQSTSGNQTPAKKKPERLPNEPWKTYLKRIGEL